MAITLNLWKVSYLIELLQVITIFGTVIIYYSTDKICGYKNLLFQKKKAKKFITPGNKNLWHNKFSDTYNVLHQIFGYL